MKVETLLVTAAALAPALFTWWRGRTLVAVGADPMLAERLFAHRQRLTWVFAGTLAVMAAFSNDPSRPFAITLCIVTALAAAFHVRKALFNETWSFLRYGIHTVRFTVARGAGVVALALAPGLVWDAAPLHWVYAGASFAALVTWSLLGQTVFLKTIGARPLACPELQSLFDAVTRRSCALEPRLYQLDMNGGRWANAFALPSFTTPAVMFTDTLLTECEPREAAAIFAHEVAHLEEHDTGWWLRCQAVYITIAAAATLLPAFVIDHPLGASVPSWAPLAWSVALLVALLLYAKRGHGQAHEAEADRRGVELCEDGEALIRALTKIHRSSLLPRRWNPDFDARASHPSLVNRVRAIRSSCGMPQPAIAAPVVVGSAEPGCYAVFEPERMHWLQRVTDTAASTPAELLAAAGDVRSIPYTEVSSLHIETPAKGPAQLVAVSAEHTLSLSLRTEDAENALVVLDGVEGELASAKTKPARGRSELGPFVAGLVMALMFMMSHFGVVLVTAALALLRSRAADFAALGAAALAGAASMALGLNGEMAPDAARALAVVLGLTGTAALFTAYRKRREPRSTTVITFVVLALLLALTGFELLVAVIEGQAALRIHEFAAGNTELPMAALALAAAFACRPRQWARAIAVALVLTSLVPVLLGSRFYAERFVDDPMLVEAPPVAWTPAEPRLLGRTVLPEFATDLRLSPAGERYAVAVYEPSEMGSFIVGDSGGGRTEVTADDLAFIDDRRIVTLTRSDSALLLTTLTLDHDDDVNARVPMVLPLLVAPALTVTPHNLGWQVHGWSSSLEQRVVLSGTADGRGYERRQWPARDPRGDTEDDPWFETGFFATQGTTVRTMQRYDSVFDRLHGQWAIHLRRYVASRGLGVSTRIETDSVDGSQGVLETSLPVRCFHSASATPDVLACGVWGREQLRIGRLNLSLEHWEPLADFPEGAFGGHLGSNERLTMLHWPREVLMVDLKTAESVRFTLPQDAPPPSEARAAGNLLWTLSHEDENAVLSRYDIAR